MLRRLSPYDDLGGVGDLMAGYVSEIRRKLRDGHSIELEAATPDSDQLVEVKALLEPPHCLYLAEVDGRAAGYRQLQLETAGCFPDFEHLARYMTLTLEEQ